MNRIIVYLVCMLTAVGASAQINVTGTVVDTQSDEPLAGASVIIKGPDGKIRNFTSTKTDGSF